MAMPIQQVSQHVCIYANQLEPLIPADDQISLEHTDNQAIKSPPTEEVHDTKYVGDECVFLLMPDGQISCVAGIENLVVNSDPNSEETIIDTIQYSRLECFSCHQVLEYDSRAAFVQCNGCNTLNAAPQNIIQETDNQTSNTATQGGRVMIVICGRCNTRNISRLGSTFVECWLCNAICQVDYPVERNTATTVSSRRQRVYTFMSQRISTRLSAHNNTSRSEGASNTTTDNTEITTTPDSNSHRENSSLRFRVKLKERMRRVIPHRRAV